MMVAKKDFKPKKLSKAHKASKAGKEKIGVPRESYIIPPKSRKRAKIRSNKIPSADQKTLRITQTKHQVRAKVKKPLAGHQESRVAARLKGRQKHHAEIRRFSFVIRLLADQNGQPRRTEIEQVEGDKKQNFLGLDGERLVTFMKACVNPTVIPEDINTLAPSTVKSIALMPGLSKQKSSLVISDGYVFRPGAPDFRTLTLAPGEPFSVQARFQFQGSKADGLIFQEFQESSYTMKVYANEVTSGRFSQLTTHTQRLIQNLSEYVAGAQVSELSSGLYRLFIVIILDAPNRVAGFYGKTILYVT